MDGPTCTQVGQTYLYMAHNYTNGVTSTHWTVSGGIITNCNCTDWNIPNLKAYAINVTWTSASTSNFVTLSTTGPTSFNQVIVTTVNPLGAGAISNPTQNKNYNSIPDDINCSVAVDGYCSPTYAYQWQRSSDNVNFSDILTSEMPSATSQNLHFITGLTQTTYYRRKVTETHGPTIAYSNTATVLIYPQLIGGSISPVSQAINYGALPSTLTLSGVSGGTNSYTYQWQNSAGAIPGAVGLTYSPPALTTSQSYWVSVSSNGVNVNSAQATVTVNPQLFPGTISPGYIIISSGTAPGSIMSLLPASGGAAPGRDGPGGRQAPHHAPPLRP